MRSFLGKGKPLQTSVTLCSLVAFVLFGYDQGVFGGILENKDWLEQFNHPSEAETGIIVSCYNAGCFAGCIRASPLFLWLAALLISVLTTSVNYVVGEKLGRRRAIWIAMAFVLVGAVLQTTAFTVPHLIVGRLVTGFGTGIKTSTVPMSVLVSFRRFPGLLVFYGVHST
jgi:MFS family permease